MTLMLGMYAFFPQLTGLYDVVGTAGGVTESGGLTVSQLSGCDGDDSAWRTSERQNRMNDWNESIIITSNANSTGSLRKAHEYAE